MTKKKVLIITYYWPPAGGPGVQRWLKFATYLTHFDIEPIVYCPDNPNYPIIDNSLVSEILKGITLVKQPIKEPYRLAKLFSKKSTKTISSGMIPKAQKQTLIQRFLLFVRGNFFIPDARKNWIKPSVSFLSTYLSTHNIDTVITTGPPHSLHIIGYKLKTSLPVKWIADFRDPWTTIGYHKALKLTNWAKQKHKDLELKVLRYADDIVVTSQHTKAEFESKTTKPITVITNGYDTRKTNPVEKDSLFTIAHIGSLLSERNPEVLWQVLSELVKENKDFAEVFQLNLVGIISNTITESLQTYGLSTFVNIVGYVNHNEAITYQLKSQLLLLIEIDSEDTKAIIPGKLFEYLISKTPILALGPKDSDVEQIIATTQTGVYLNYHQKSELKTQILHYFDSYKKGLLKSNPVEVEQYSRKALTKALAQVILK